MNEESEVEDDLPSSELGRKEHWDSCYATEYALLVENGLVPEGWFGNVTHRVMKYLKDNSLKGDRILDLGCGNGDTILKLAELGWENLTGFDYSGNAIKVCELLFQQKCPDVTIQLDIVDLVNMNKSQYGNEYKICLDKGTYDAICLNPELSKAEMGVTRSRYWENVYHLLQPEGVLVIVSCNWTWEELVSHAFEWFCLKERIPTSNFMFGQGEGETTCLCVFSKKK